MIVETSNSLEEAGRLIEIGWLVGNDLDETDYQAVIQTRQRMLALLQDQFGQFDWRMPMVRQPASLQADWSHSASLLYEGAYERDNRSWDFVLVITATDLKSHYKPYALAMPSRTLSVAVISTARLSTLSLSIADNSPNPVELKVQRLYALGLHLLGDLNGVEHSDQAECFLYEPREIEDLDRMNRFTQNERELLIKAFTEVADLRLEEQPHLQTMNIIGFYLKGIWHLKTDIYSAIKQAKPWEFPFRLSRLSTAALSALFVLLITAEAWDLGMSQEPLRMFFLSALTLIGASAFIIKRQRLLLRYSRRRLSEQIVVTTVAISTVVILGMAFTYLILFTTTLVLAGFLFGDELVASWAASLNGRIGWQNYWTLGQLTASFGLIIGALGASFEGQEYFRHIAYVDEEL
jgi:predicted Zn-dependent protease